MPKNDLISKYIRPLTPRPTSLRPSGNLKAKVRCVLFDVYGTLFISESGDISIAKRESQQIDKLESLLLQFRIDRNPQFILKTFFEAIDQQHKQQRAEGIDFPEVEIDQIWKQVLKVDDLNTIRSFALEFELIVNPVYPMPHLEKMLTSCQKSNILMGIISNAQFYTPFLFTWFLGAGPENLGFHPDLMFFSYKFGYAKPSTFLFRRAAEKLEQMDIPADAALYLGNDMLNDIYPAKQAGFQTALFAGDARSLRLRENDSRCSNLSADIVITNLEQLLYQVNAQRKA